MEKLTPVAFFILTIVATISTVIEATNGIDAGGLFTVFIGFMVIVPMISLTFAAMFCAMMFWLYKVFS